MKVTVVRLIQKFLTQEGYAPGPADGQLGDNTYKALQQALQKRKANLPGDWATWPNTRKTVAYVQLLGKEHQLEVGAIDGYWGPQTDFAFESLQHILEKGTPPAPWRDETPLNVNPNGWPQQNEAELTRFYGAVGTNLVSVSLPYPHRLSWALNQTINSFQCNAKVRDSIQRVLTGVLQHYGLERIRALGLDRWGGCFNNRVMRGGTKRSMHAWGIAIDYDPEHNQLKWGRDKAVFARSDYDMWWTLWEQEGWVSLGRTKNYDWMHVQAAKN